MSLMRGHGVHHAHLLTVWKIPQHVQMKAAAKWMLMLLQAFSALLSVHSICIDLHKAGSSRADLCRPNRLIYQGHLDVSCTLDDMEVCDNVALIVPEKA